MNNIIDSTNEQIMVLLDSALRRRGVDSFVQNAGVTPDNDPIYAVVTPLVTEAARARRLLYSDSQFLSDMNPELANYVRGIRGNNLVMLGGLLQSKFIYKLSILALIAIVVGYFAGF